MDGAVAIATIGVFDAQYGVALLLPRDVATVFCPEV
jgi:hypothetical protein